MGMELRGVVRWMLNFLDLPYMDLVNLFGKLSSLVTLALLLFL